MCPLLCFCFFSGGNMWRIKKRIFATIIQIIKENDKTNETMDVGRHPNLRH